MHKAAVAFGSFRIWSLSHIPVPFPPSAGDFTILAGDWFKLGHCRLRRVLENGHNLPFPDCLLINGCGWNGNTFCHCQSRSAGKTYGFRISNVGLAASINFRIQGHSLKLVEVEGSHTLQSTYIFFTR
ncbi:L-ascorbate oxidase protein [Trifolium repens]|nr:L-ascorbate oxidase protein [Trifolium repens]